MAKYGRKAQKAVARVMHERKEGTLRSGSGKKVTSRKQAIAIGLSEAREAGAKVPRKAAGRSGTGKTSGSKKTATRKTAKKATGKKRGTKKTAAKKSGSKKTGTTRHSARRR
ncbi:MAG: DUF6496 domain-containing protein [Vicinamibacterales bacterium]